MDPDLQEPLPRVYDLFVRLISDDDKEYKMFRRIIQKQLAGLINEFDIQKHTTQPIHQDVITFPCSVGCVCCWFWDHVFGVDLAWVSLCEYWLEDMAIVGYFLSV